MQSMKKACLVIVTALLCVFFAACAKPQNASQLTVAAQQEAYIDKSELKLPQATQSPHPETELLDAYDREAAPATSAPTAAPEAKGEKVTLVPVEVCGQALYRLNDTNYLSKYPNVYNNDAMIAVTRCATILKELAVKHPNLKIYTYYVTRSTDCDWYQETEGISVFDLATFFENQFEGTDIKSDRYHIADFEDYMDTGFKTDFHINYKGSDRIYGDVYNMMSKDIDMGARRQPVEVLDFDNLLISGDYYNVNLDVDNESALLTDDQLDVFKAYRYELGEFKTYIKDTEIVLGLEAEYMAGQIRRVRNVGHQFIYYGGQTDVVRFEFNQPDRPNLLMCSDSQGRPSRNAIASHFNRTIFMDTDQWREGDLDQIIEENNITVMLLIGQHSMFEIYE